MSKEQKDEVVGPSWDPRDKIGSVECISKKLYKEAGKPAGIVLREVCTGVLEIRGTKEGLAAHEQELDALSGYLLVGVNGTPVYTVAEVGEILQDMSEVTLHLVLPSPDDVSPPRKPPKS